MMLLKAWMMKLKFLKVRIKRYRFFKQISAFPGVAI